MYEVVLHVDRNDHFQMLIEFFKLCALFKISPLEDSIILAKKDAQS